ncbi:MAG: HD domain-containing protein [Planctomycetaceae bacterium]|jgi:HD-GYP domain-containing protein (c-di-GMP phosphodiesterase class II)|nr:HD domain-containing protein [Planctomycetaceae bacterium]
MDTITLPANSGTIAPPPDRMAVLKLSQLRTGVKLRSPIYDGGKPNRPLLLASGRVLTASQLALLRRRGVSEVLVDPREVERLTNGADGPKLIRDVRGSTPAPESRSPSVPGWMVRPDSFLHQLKPCEDPKPSREVLDRFSAAYRHDTEQTREIFSEFREQRKVDPERVVRVAVSHLSSICENLPLFITQSAQPILHDYPSRHSLQTAMLAAGMGTVMGLTASELKDLSFGCLLHDAGLTLLPERLVEARGELTWSDQIEFRKHPIYTANVLNKLNSVSHHAKMVAYQIHERLDGSGYPKQRSGQQIHPLARIAMVADTYLMLVSSCAQRAPLKPYQAIEKILQASRSGEFDSPAVRALLHTVSLFPVGSAVRLSDGRAARVLRANDGLFARPVVEAIDLTGQHHDVEIVDLAKNPDLTIVGVGDALPLFS